MCHDDSSVGPSIVGGLFIDDKVFFKHFIMVGKSFFHPKKNCSSHRSLISLLFLLIFPPLFHTVCRNDGSCEACLIGGLYYNHKVFFKHFITVGKSFFHPKKNCSSHRSLISLLFLSSFLLFFTQCVMMMVPLDPVL